MRYFWIFIFWVGNSYFAAELILSLPEAKSHFPTCEVSPREPFVFTESLFRDSRETALRILQKEALELGKIRWNQLNCLEKLKLSSSEKLQLETVLDYYQQKEIDLLMFNSNYLLHFDKLNKMSAEEVLLTNSFLKSKKDLYALLHKRTMEYLFADGKEIFREGDYKNIYLSLLRLQYEYYTNLSPNLRKEIFKGTQ